MGTHTEGAIDCCQPWLASRHTYLASNEARLAANFAASQPIASGIHRVEWFPNFSLPFMVRAAY
jgi:hypothetical protein